MPWFLSSISFPFSTFALGWVRSPHFPLNPFLFGKCGERGHSSGAIVYCGRRGPGGSARRTGASRPLAPPAVRQGTNARDWPNPARPHPGPAPPLALAVCILQGWGVQRVVSSSSQGCCGVPRPPRVGREGRAGVDWSYGNCCVSPSRWLLLWVAPSSGVGFYGDYTLLAWATLAPCSQGV